MNTMFIDLLLYVIVMTGFYPSLCYEHLVIYGVRKSIV